MPGIASRVIEETLSRVERELLTLTEGIDDPGILKCVFMAGGPGSGKGFASAQLFGIDQRFKASFSTFGLKVVNSDNMFEYLLKQLGVDIGQLGNLKKSNPELFFQLTDAPGSIREKAKDLTRKMHLNFLNGRLGLIIDGTGKSAAKVAIQKKEAESYGYDCMMVLVNTDLDIALERNRKRARVLPDDVVEEMWHEVQAQIPAYRTMFGRNFVEIRNNVPADAMSDIHRIVRAFINAPLRNPFGHEWITIARAVEHLSEQ